MKKNQHDGKTPYHYEEKDQKEKYIRKDKYTIKEEDIQKLEKWWNKTRDRWTNKKPIIGWEDTNGKLMNSKELSRVGKERVRY
jgi:TRAP-type C4-dicarboxylate transport system substrate-binding protein